MLIAVHLLIQWANRGTKIYCAEILELFVKMSSQFDLELDFYKQWIGQWIVFFFAGWKKVYILFNFFSRDLIIFQLTDTQINEFIVGYLITMSLAHGGVEKFF